MQISYRNLDTLLDAMRANDPSLNWNFLPLFGGDAPRDQTQIWSWDHDRLIVGTCPDDVKIISRTMYKSTIKEITAEESSEESSDVTEIREAAAILAPSDETAAFRAGYRHGFCWPESLEAISGFFGVDWAQFKAGHSAGRADRAQWGRSPGRATTWR